MSHRALLIASVLLAAGWNGTKLNAAELAITTASPIGATVGTAFSQTFAASNGISPYTWGVQSGALPSGLSLNTAGLLSGTPTQSGLFSFTVAVTDSSGESASSAFSLIVALPPTPTVSITGLPATVSPAQQPVFGVQLSSAYWLDIAGSVTLTFTPNAVNDSDDPSIQFSTGGRTLNFTIPAGQTTASWESLPAVQTGTVAGLLKLGLKFSAGGLNLTPILAPFFSVAIAQAAPQIDSVQVAKTTGGFDVLIAGYSTPREVTQATFDFTTTNAGSPQTESLTASVANTFTAWYTGESATQYGSAFLYTQSFTVQGSVSDIASVSVTLLNSTGTSSAVSASF
jgi:hypothetical protein